MIQYGEGTNRNILINTRSNATTHLITGLKPFTQYTFTVAGVNSVNTGPISNASKLIRTYQDSKYMFISYAHSNIFSLWTEELVKKNNNTQEHVFC